MPASPGVVTGGARTFEAAPERITAVGRYALARRCRRAAPWDWCGTCPTASSTSGGQSWIC